MQPSPRFLPSKWRRGSRALDATRLLLARAMKHSSGQKRLHGRSTRVEVGMVFLEPNGVSSWFLAREAATAMATYEDRCSDLSRMSEPCM